MEKSGMIKEPIKYKIPEWCQMPMGYHNDGIGGCWSISFGYVTKEGEECCKDCEFYRGEKKKEK